MKVLFLTHSFPRQVGDAPGSFILKLATSLRDEGVETSVVAPAAAGVPDHDRVEDIPVDRVPLRAAPVRDARVCRQHGEPGPGLVGRQGHACSDSSAPSFGRRCSARRAWQPDVVHAHWWFPNGLVGTWLSRMANKPLVTTLHGTDVRLARSVAFSRPAFRHVMHHSAAVTAVSRWLAEEAREVVSAPALVVAPMPVAAELFSPGGSRESARLLFVGRLNKQKGIELLAPRAVAAPESRRSASTSSATARIAKPSRNWRGRSAWRIASPGTAPAAPAARGVLPRAPRRSSSRRWERGWASWRWRRSCATRPSWRSIPADCPTSCSTIGRACS